MGYCDRFKVDVPEGTSGSWSVQRFTVTEAEAQLDLMRSILGGSGRRVPSGTYTGLYRSTRVVMSDTPDEILDHLDFIRKATGRVLIHGLGLGMCARAALLKDEVTSVTVVEISPDVIKLVGPWLAAQAKQKGKDLDIHEADCFTWSPKKGERWDAIWHDVWDDLCTDNLEAMAKMHRRFGRRCTWQGSWGKTLLQYQRSRGR